MRFAAPAEAENRPKSAHRYNVAEQQLIYKSEIERIWKAQFDSLSRKDEPQLSDDEDKKDAKKPQMPPAAPSGPAGRSSPPFSRGSSLEREGSVGLDASKSVLRIKRLVSYYSLYTHLLNLNAIFQIDGVWQTEIIRDPAVIRAYVRGRQVLEEEATLADSLAPTGDIDKDKRAKKRYDGPLTDPPKWLHQCLLVPYNRLEEEIARMKKNQERRLHRKNAKIVKEGGIPMQLNRPVKPDTTVSRIFKSPSAWFSNSCVISSDDVATVDKWVI